MKRDRCDLEEKTSARGSDSAIWAVNPLPPVKKEAGHKDQMSHIGALPQTDRHFSKTFFMEIKILAFYTFAANTYFATDANYKNRIFSLEINDRVEICGQLNLTI